MRKITEIAIALCTDEHYLYNQRIVALCEDNTLWLFRHFEDESGHHMGWDLLPEIPE